MVARKGQIMDLKSFYSNVGGDYDVMMGRMGNKEERIIKFLNKFMNDPSFENLKEAAMRKKLFGRPIPSKV